MLKSFSLSVSIAQSLAIQSLQYSADIKKKSVPDTQPM